MKLGKKIIEEITKKGVERIIKKESLIEKLKRKKKLRIKYGIDPTTPLLHLGHYVILKRLKFFQKLGHKIVLIIGDFTARFGDPTGKLKMRKLRTKKEVLKTAKDYLLQIGKILDLKKTEVYYNSSWYDKMKIEKLLRLLSHFTVSRMLERDFFEKRMKKGIKIGLHEPIYPLLQGYDSVMIRSDLTINGSDQIFNELCGRKLQKEFGQKPQDILALKILAGIDGQKKMSQSLGNYIALFEKPLSQYGKIMRIPDSLIVDYFLLLTNIPLKEIKKFERELKRKKVNPKDLKAKLAFQIVADLHGRGKAEEAEKEFERIFKKKKPPSKIRVFKTKKKIWKITHFLKKTGLASSKSEAKRLISQGALKINGKKFLDWKKEIKLKDKMIIKVGKRRFLKIKIL